MSQSPYQPVVPTRTLSLVRFQFEPRLGAIISGRIDLAPASLDECPAVIRSGLCGCLRAWILLLEAEAAGEGLIPLGDAHADDPRESAAPAGLLSRDLERYRTTTRELESRWPAETALARAYLPDARTALLALVPPGPSESDSAYAPEGSVGFFRPLDAWPSFPGHRPPPGPSLEFRENMRAVLGRLLGGA